MLFKGIRGKVEVYIKQFMNSVKQKIYLLKSGCLLKVTARHIVVIKAHGTYANRYVIGK